ncbi:MAG: helix-turn-helix domain-containing protein [Lachnospiraceae bacterium]|nr:helix-turn-helix domain-containing protein [Lachnospiraceae bacterium]
METRIYMKKMKEFRTKANYTQQEISDLLNIQRQTYSNYENGSRMPPMEVMIRLTEIYSVSLDFMIRGVESRLLSKEQRVLLDEFSRLRIDDQLEILQMILSKRQSMPQN